MKNYATAVSTPIPQTEPLDDRQTKNHAGGFAYTIDKWSRLDRFLILGSDSNTFYQKARELTVESAKCVEACYAEDAKRTVSVIVDVSLTGRAPKNDAAIFALALGAGNADLKTRQAALSALSLVCRTSTHLFQFTRIMKALGKRGWGRSLKRNVADWYNKKSVDDLAYQFIKYREREGWKHGDVLRLAHPSGDILSTERTALYRWARGKDAEGMLPLRVQAHIEAMKFEKVTPEVLKHIAKYKLPWEAIPNGFLKDADVWKTMLPSMPLGAMIRNLGRMTAYGALTPLSSETSDVARKLTDPAALRKARVHPMAILMALKAYQVGRPMTNRVSTMAWSPIPTIIDALDEAFVMAFQNVEPTGKKTLIGIDVSGSMTSPMSGKAISCAEAAAAMAMVTMRLEKNWHVMAFDDGIRDLKISAKSSLDSVLKKTENINAGGTDCALPMRYALDAKLDVDVFQVITDNETWAGRVHPMVALRDYRKKYNPEAKLVVMGMTATDISIADPNDAGCLDVVGFDASVPTLIANFARGKAVAGGDDEGGDDADAE